MTASEPGRQVCVPARMYTGVEWIGVTILNMSSSGLTLRMEGVVPHGSYVEVRRGRLTIIARVVSIEDDHLGLVSQDHIEIDALVNEPRLSARPGVPKGQDTQAERRSMARHDAARRAASIAESSRTFASKFQFVSIVAAGSVVSIILFGIVGRLLISVSTTIRTALGG
jgi:hypothetical protein